MVALSNYGEVLGPRCLSEKVGQAQSCALSLAVFAVILANGIAGFLWTVWKFEVRSLQALAPQVWKCLLLIKQSIARSVHDRIPLSDFL